MITKDKESAAREIENAVYEATCHIYERLEFAGAIFGNGHHIAQKVSRFAADLVRERWRNQEEKT